MKTPQRSAISYLLFPILFFAVPPAGAAVIPAASCNAPDVQAAIDVAVDGDTVTIPAGTCTWTQGVAISKRLDWNSNTNSYDYAFKAITLQGAGMDQTIILLADSGISAVLKSTGLTRVTGLTLN